MNAADIQALRAKACDVMGALGYIVDQLTIADQVIVAPAAVSPEAAANNADVVAKYLETARGHCEHLTDGANVLGLALEMQAEAAKQHAAALRAQAGGGASP